MEETRNQPASHGVRSRASIAGHPLHHMLVPFPIALLAMVPLTDIGWWATGEAFWARASWWLLWAGLVGGALAAVAGLVDFVTIRRARAHRQGWYHVLAVGSVVGLTVVNLFVRAGDVAQGVLPSGLILSLVTLGLLVVGAWYGGELAYRHEIGVVGHPPPGRLQRRARRRDATPGTAG